MKELRVIIAGSRTFSNYDLLKSELEMYFNNYDRNNTIIISGCAKGADQLGEKFANEHQYNIKRFPADWNKHGKSAGPIRNREMAEYASCGLGVLFAFWYGKSRCTKNMIDLGIEYDLDVHIIYSYIENICRR